MFKLSTKPGICSSQQIRSHLKDLFTTVKVCRCLGVESYCENIIIRIFHKFMTKLNCFTYLVDLEEPFSDSDDNDTLKGPKKLTLTIPQGRIRTLSGTVPAVGYRFVFSDALHFKSSFTSHLFLQIFI